MKRLVAVALVVVGLGLVPAALATGVLSGSFQEKITNDPALHGALNATWKIMFIPGHYKVYRNGKFFGGGKDKFPAPHRITFLTGVKCSSPGRYKYVRGGPELGPNGLGFSKISDACVGRRDVLTHGPFHKVS
jgi:hypothetical protein